MPIEKLQYYYITLYFSRNKRGKGSMDVHGRVEKYERSEYTTCDT